MVPELCSAWGRVWKLLLQNLHHFIINNPLTPRALWEDMGAHTGMQIDRQAVYGRQRVNSERPATDIKGIKLVTEMYGVLIRCQSLS